MCFPVQRAQGSRSRTATPSAGRRPRIPASPAACPCRTAALENIRLSAQVHTPHASRFIGVGEASFQKLSPIPQQLFPVLAVNAPPVVIHRLPRLRLILPATASTVRFRNIAPNLGLLQRRQRVVAVISLVRHCFDRTFKMDSFPLLLRCSWRRQLRRCAPSPAARFPESSPYRPQRHRPPSPPPPLQFPDPPHAPPCRRGACGRLGSAVQSV